MSGTPQGVNRHVNRGFLHENCLSMLTFKLRLKTLSPDIQTRSFSRLRERQRSCGCWQSGWVWAVWYQNVRECSRAACLVLWVCTTTKQSLEHRYLHPLSRARESKRMSNRKLGSGCRFDRLVLPCPPLFTQKPLAFPPNFFHHAFL